MSKKTAGINNLPWFKFWTGNFRSRTDHLSNAEVGAYMRLLASYWDNSGLPNDHLALYRIARIEEEDRVYLDDLMAQFFDVRDGEFYHEEMEALRADAIGEEEANRRRTMRARLTRAQQRSEEQRLSATIPVTETDINVDEEREGDGNGDVHPEQEPEANPQADEKSTSKTDTQTADTQVEADRQGKPDAHSSASFCPFTPEQQAEIDKHPPRTRERLAAIQKFSAAA